MTPAIVRAGIREPLVRVCSGGEQALVAHLYGGTWSLGPGCFGLPALQGSQIRNDLQPLEQCQTRALHAGAGNTVSQDFIDGEVAIAVIILRTVQRRREWSPRSIDAMARAASFMKDASPLLAVVVAGVCAELNARIRGCSLACNDIPSRGASTAKAPSTTGRELGPSPFAHRPAPGIRPCSKFARSTCLLDSQTIPLPPDADTRPPRPFRSERWPRPQS